MKNRREVLFWICLTVFIMSVSFMIGWWLKLEKNGDVYEQLQEMNKPIPTVTPTPTEDVKLPSSSENIEPTLAPTKEPEVIKPVVEIPIAFDSLQKVNDEIYAWIRIPGTKVDYPILQRASDDDYYLNHTVNGKRGYPGSIYTESLNQKNFQDRNTVIYGHNMKSGKMFGTLHKYKNAEYMKEHSEIIIYTPEHIYTYEVFCAVTYDNRHLLYSFDFTEESGMQQFLDSIASIRNMSSFVNEDVTVTSSDRIITLSTCVGNKGKRFFVGAVLVDEQ